MDKLPEKILSFKDFLVVDYTGQAGSEVDPLGIIAYNAQKRKRGSGGGGPNEETKVINKNND